MAKINTDFKAGTWVLIIVVAIAALSIGYFAGRQQGGPSDSTRKNEAEPRPAQIQEGSEQAISTTRLPTTLLQNHPPKGLPPRTGRAHQAGGLDPKAEFTHFRVGQRNVKRILADGDTMWVGTSGGVIRYHTRSDEYRLYDLRSGLLANGIFHVGKLGRRVVVGTYGGGMALYDRPADTWKVYNIPDGLADAFVYDVLETERGDIWIATWSGANRVRAGALDDPAKWDLFTVANTQGGLPNDWVYSLAKGRDGSVWFATEGGLAHYQDGTWENWQHDDGLGAPYERVHTQIQYTHDPAQFSRHHARQKSEMGLEDVDVAYNPNYIVALLIDRDDNVWCGTWGGGLARFDGSSWQNFTRSEGLPGNHVFALHQDPQGRLWVGTNDGLARRDGDTFTVFTTADGLFSNTVFAMATADDGSTWVGSFGGVARVAKLD